VILQSVKDGLSLFWTRLQADLKFMWDNDRIFLVIFGVLVLILKGSQMMISFLAFKSKVQVAVASKEDSVLKAQETADENQANDLEAKAAALPSQQPPVDENWDKKK
jgi:hypothetical protein